MSHKRGSQCKRGHEYTAESSYVNPRGERICRICRRIRDGYTGERHIPAESRFWAKVAKTDNCWNWTGIVTPNGYGQLSINDKKVVTHRYSYQLAKGDIPDGLVVMHSCDNRRCVNPAHLSLGTKKENTWDMMFKQRHANANKTHCPKGHPYSVDNLMPSRGRANRNCLTCYKNRLEREKQQRRKAKEVI